MSALDHLTMILQKKADSAPLGRGVTVGLSFAREGTKVNFD